MAIAILNDTNVVYLPFAFDEVSLETSQERFPEAVILTEEDPSVLVLNSFTKGHNVVIAAR